MEHRVWSTQAQQLRCAGSLVEARGLSHTVVCGVLVPQPEIEPASPALEGRFSTTGPPGKSPAMPFSTVLFQSGIQSRFTFATGYCISLVSFNLQQSLAFFPLTLNFFFNSSDKSHYRMSHTHLAVPSSHCSVFSFISHVSCPYQGSLELD